MRNRRYYSNPWPEPSADHAISWQNFLAALDPADPETEAALRLARVHWIPPWKAAERIRDFGHRETQTRH